MIYRRSVASVCLTDNAPPLRRANIQWHTRQHRARGLRTLAGTIRVHVETNIALVPDHWAASTRLPADGAKHVASRRRSNIQPYCAFARFCGAPGATAMSPPL